MSSCLAAGLFVYTTFILGFQAELPGVQCRIVRAAY